MRDTRADAMQDCFGEKILGKERGNLIFTGSVTHVLDCSKEISRNLWTCFSLWFSFLCLSRLFIYEDK